LRLRRPGIHVLDLREKRARTELSGGPSSARLQCQPMKRHNG